jgi:hypothetical protein
VSLALDFELHKKQALVLQSKATEILYGGAAGGGKSHVSRVLSILFALEIPGIQIYLFRRLYEDLIKNHLEGPTGFRAMLAPWINCKHPKSPLIGGRLAEVVEGQIRFWNGSKIHLCHLQHQKDLTKYYGPEFHVLFIEEATQFTEYMIRFLRSRLRIPTSLKIPDKYLKPEAEWKDPAVPSYYFPRAIYTSNPGGVGHAYFKRAFIEGHEAMKTHIAPPLDGGHTREFIPAKVDDNPSVNREEVKANLSGLPPQLVDAMLNGNWNAVIGAYYPECDPFLHIIEPFPIPPWWTRMVGMDWGACGDGDPFSIGWWAVSDGSIHPYPKGYMVCYRRWYGRGLGKMTASAVAKGILEREKLDPNITQRVAGGDILEQRGHGQSILDIFAENGVHFSRADMRRLSGWNQIRERLVGVGGQPMMGWFKNCADGLDLLSQLQHNPNDPEDCVGDDHDPDMTRYVLMNNPWAAEKPPTEKPLAERFAKPTMEQMWAIRESQMRSR